jgi:hypothetical protein
MQMMDGMPIGMATGKPDNWRSAITNLAFGNHVHMVATYVNHLARRWQITAHFCQFQKVA